jgi:phospholipid/cholesterol/gamma-HCH transport system substrate-binding protein
LFLILLVEATRSIISVGAITHPYTLNAEFSNGIGVLTHSEVAYLGVPVGEVATVKRVPGGVVVRMAVNKDHRIPTGSIAALGRKSAIGEQYINFSPPTGYQGNHGPYYPAGYTVPMALDPAHPDKGYTTVPLEFSELLRSAANLIGSIPPDALATLVHDAAIGLNGRSDSLRAMAESGDKLSATLVTRTQALNQLITNNTKLTHVVTDHRQSLGQSLTDLRQVAATLQAAQGDTNQLLDKGTPLLQQVADIVAAQKGNLDCSLKYLNQLIDLTSTPRKVNELTALLDLGPTGFADVWSTLDRNDPGPTGVPGGAGPWIRVGFIVNTQTAPAWPANPSDKVDQDLNFPTPPPVGPCTSPLRPDPPNYRPASAVFGMGQGPLPPVAADILLGLCLALAAMAVLRRRSFAGPRGQ